MLTHAPVTRLDTHGNRRNTGDLSAMKSSKSFLAGKLALVFTAGLALTSTHTTPHPLHGEQFHSPPIFFWAWDEPEDMRALAGRDAGVAFLAATMLLDESLHVSPRLQPLRLAPGTPLISVVRVETRAGFHNTSQLREGLIAAILDVTSRSGTSAVQIDFDATRSERQFYAAVLRDLRTKLPMGTSLSMTALLSWCAHDDWIHALPIDEAVPMYFRLGKEAHSVYNGDSAYAIREPLCSTSAGVATDEPSPNLVLANKREYLFNPRPWTARQQQLLARVRKP